MARSRKRKAKTIDRSAAAKRQYLFDRDPLRSEMQHPEDYGVGDVDDVAAMGQPDARGKLKAPKSLHKRDPSVERDRTQPPRRRKSS